MSTATLSQPRTIVVNGQTRELKKYRVLEGQHVEPDWTKQPDKDGMRSLVKHRAIPQQGGGWVPSAPFDSPTDLEGRFNTHISRKFERVHEETGLPSGAYALPATAHVWDSDKESFEDFAARVKQSQALLSTHPLGVGEQTAQSTAGVPTDVKVIPVVPAQPTQGVGGNLPHEGPQVKVTVAKQKVAVEVLRKMTEQQLKAYAEEEEIDLGGVTKKDDLIKKIQTAQG